MKAREDMNSRSLKKSIVNLRSHCNSKFTVIRSLILSTTQSCSLKPNKGWCRLEWKEANKKWESNYRMLSLLACVTWLGSWLVNTDCYYLTSAINTPTSSCIDFSDWEFPISSKLSSLLVHFTTSSPVYLLTSA